MKTKYENLLLLDVPRTTALVIEVLSDNKEHSLRDIERKSDLRQPEVSIAIGCLTPYISVEEKRAASGGKGRPRKHVTMKREAFAKYVEARMKCHEEAYYAAKRAREELLKE